MAAPGTQSTRVDSDDATPELGESQKTGGNGREKFKKWNGVTISDEEINRRVQSLYSNVRSGGPRLSTHSGEAFVLASRCDSFIKLTVALNDGYWVATVDGPDYPTQAPLFDRQSDSILD